MTTSWGCESLSRNANVPALWVQSPPSLRDLPNHHLHDGRGMYRHHQGGTGEAGLSTPLVTGVKDDLPAQSEATALVMSNTGGPLSMVAVQGLDVGHVRGLFSGNVLLLVLDGIHPSLMADDPKSVPAGMIHDRRVVQLPEIDVVRTWEPTGSTGIDTMARTKSHPGQEHLRHNLSHPGSAV